MVFAHILHLILFFFTVDATHTKSFTTVSGRQISVTAIHRLHPHIDESHLPHILFEHDKQTNQLSSHHSSIQLPPLQKRFNIPSYPIPYSLNGVPQSETDDEMPLISKSNDGHTFIFDKHGEDNNTLTAAWGPNLLLHSIGERSDIFINTLNVGSKPIQQVDSLSRAIPQTCSKTYEFELGLAYDASFCALHKNNAKQTNNILKSLVFDISQIFRNTVCVIPRIIYIDSHCNKGSRPDNKFSQPSTLSTCNTEDDDCERSKIMLELVSNEWDRSVSAGAHRDAAFLFSGYSDGSSLAGATYRAQACNEKLSFAWIEKAIPVVFAHEVGHMLGARHDDAGLMTAVVRTDTDEISLSRGSQAVIKRFVENDSRSWCLRRNGDSFGSLQTQYGWFSVGTYIRDENRKVNVSDLTFSGKNGNYLISLISDRVDDIGNVELSLRLSPDVKCAENGVCGIDQESKAKSNVIHKLSNIAPFRPNSYGFGIAYGNIKDSMSDDIVLSHLKMLPTKMGNTQRAVPFYRVGFNMNLMNASFPSEWSKERRIKQVSGGDVQCASITTGHIRSNTKTDILYIHIDKKIKRNTMSYAVGFDMSKTGYIRGGWSGLIEIPGWYGRETTGVSASLVDIDKNGMPDLVVYHMDDTPTFKMGYIRIGKNLNSTGHVTGGWSNFVRAALLYPLPIERGGSMDVTEIDGKFVVVTAQREQSFFLKGWRMYFGSRVVGTDLLSTSGDRPAYEDLSDGCDECYPKRQARQCKRDLSRCQSKIDEVSIASQPLSKDNANDSPVTTSEYEVEEEESDGHDSEFFTYPNRPERPLIDSIFCEGFHYLYTRRGGCDVIDKETVLAEGLQQAFTQKITEDDFDITNILESTSLFEDPAGVHGNGQQIAVQAKINNKNLKYREIVKRAFNKLKKKKGFTNHFLDPFKDLDRSVVKRRGKWVVTFFFKPTEV